MGYKFDRFFLLRLAGLFLLYQKDILTTLIRVEMKVKHLFTDVTNFAQTYNNIAKY